ncbi:MAG TPA: FHA domain-containing protein [Solirubrobacteraceae bacterium]|nr:FHA domain-containing protein [Solirubrobacteraceae bacterium]
MSTNASTQPEQATSPATEGITERVDAVSRLDPRARRHATSVPAMPAPPPVEPGRYLEVQGPGERLLVRLEREVTRIGRGLSADLRLEENSVSRRHAMLVNDPDGARVLDDRSSNGTFVNGRRVEQAPLHNGDELTLGRLVLRFLEV